MYTFLKFYMLKPKNGGLVQLFLFSRVIFRFHVLIFLGVRIMDFFCHGRLSGFHPLPKFHVKREPKLGCNLQGEPDLSKQELHWSFLSILHTSSYHHQEPKWLYLQPQKKTRPSFRCHPWAASIEQWKTPWLFFGYTNELYYPVKGRSL